jgi:hypothetical protein
MTGKEEISITPEPIVLSIFISETIISFPPVIGTVKELAGVTTGLSRYPGIVYK